MKCRDKAYIVGEIVLLVLSLVVAVVWEPICWLFGLAAALAIIGSWMNLKKQK